MCQNNFIFYLTTFAKNAKNNFSSISGLDAELFYVRDGIVNNYAMMFVVPVNASINDLEFSWQSLTSYPVILNVIFCAHFLLLLNRLLIV